MADTFVHEFGYREVRVEETRSMGLGISCKASHSSRLWGRIVLASTCACRASTLGLSWHETDCSCGCWPWVKSVGLNSRNSQVLPSKDYSLRVWPIMLIKPYLALILALGVLQKGLS